MISPERQLMLHNDFLDRYCTPLAGKDGQFLCEANQRRAAADDDSIRSPSLFEINVDEALAAAAAAGDNDGPPANGIAAPVPAVVEPLPIPTIDVGGGVVTKSTPEIFPLVMGSVLIAASVAFTAFTLFVVYGKRRENRTALISKDGDAETVARQGDDNNYDTETNTREGKMVMAHTHNSWVLGNSRGGTVGTRLGDESALPDEVGGQNNSTIMAWKNLSCSYPSKKNGGPDVTTLSEVTGHIQYTELVAIMGGSGGGKSTLMDMLSGRKVLGNLGGEMSVLGEAIAPKSTDCKDILRDVAAYVPQNEEFFPNQTPEEAVEFVANLKLGKDERGREVRKRRVDQVLDLVGIPMAARKRAIGGTLAGGMVIRGLSGGERKRLALACAIAMKPKILFLDEITSGLDSENAVLVVDLIKKLCVYMNVAAIVVIHQPSYEVFSHFDRLIMLSKGKCVYADKIDKIASFYDEIGREMPEKYLIPSDILKLNCDDASNWNAGGYSSSNRPNQLVESTGKKLLQEVKSRKKPSLFLKFETLLLRQMMNHYVRNLTNLLSRVLIYSITGALLGAVFWKIANTEADEPLSLDQAQASFGAGLFLTQVYYLLPFAQVSTFFFDKKLFAAESGIGLYPAWLYSICQLTLEIWVMVLCALTQAAISIPMMSFWNPSMSKAASFVTMFSVFSAAGVLGNAMIMLISILVWSQDLAFLVASANVVIFLALSGGFVPFPYIEDWIVWLQWISPIKYTFQGLVWALLSNTPTEALLESMELDTPPNVTYNIIINMGFFVIIAGCSVFALSRQREVR